MISISGDSRENIGVKAAPTKLVKVAALVYYRNIVFYQLDYR